MAFFASGHPDPGAAGAVPPAGPPVAAARDLGRRIREEVEGGLRNERARLDAALYNREFYEANFSRFPTRPPEEFQAYRHTRTSLLMQRVVNVLTEHLYRRGPARSIPGHDRAAAWLAAAYKAGAVDALWQAADRAATIADFCAFEVVPTRDPERPITFHLWDASELVVWVDPDDQRRPAAVGVIDRHNEGRRLRVWTAERVDHYRTGELALWQTAAGTAYRFERSEPHPYGCLPFAFVHFQFPAASFYAGGIGTHLRLVNDWLNFHLTESGDSIRYAGRPIMTARHVPEGWAPGQLRPGKLLFLPDGSSDITGAGPSPELAYLQADLGFVASGWEDAKAYIEHTLELANVPPNSIRMVPTSSQSGVAIVSEQIPLIRWAEARQPAFALYESDLCRVTLKVAAAHLRRGAAAVAELAELAVTAGALDRAAAEGELSLRWGSMYPSLPGVERDRADDWELQQGLTSRTRILMRRHGFTREEALEELRRVAEDAVEEARIADALAPPEPGPGPEPGPDADPTAGPDDPAPAGPPSPPSPPAPPPRAAAAPSGR